MSLQTTSITVPSARDTRLSGARSTFAATTAPATQVTASGTEG